MRWRVLAFLLKSDMAKAYRLDGIHLAIALHCTGVSGEAETLRMHRQTMKRQMQGWCCRAQNLSQHGKQRRMRRSATQTIQELAPHQA
jgi:hypothetical protein